MRTLNILMGEFGNGDIDTKKHILHCLGSNLNLKDRILRVELKPPLRMASEMVLEVQALHAILEPTQLPTTKQYLEVIYS